MNNINYEYYRVFYYVAKYKNITKAARLLGNNQPNVTRMIHRLEEELGSILLTRSNRGVELTAEGELLYSHIEVAIHQISTAEKELQEMKELKKGSISIGCTETALNLYLLDKLSVYHKKYPGIQIHITNHTTPQAVQALKNGLVDCAIVTTPIKIDTTIHSQILSTFEEIFVAGMDYREIMMCDSDIKHYMHYPIIMLSKNTATRAYYDQWFLERQLELKPAIEVATADQILPLIIKNLGIGFVPEIMVKDALKEGSVFEIPLNEKCPKRNIILLTNQTNHNRTILNSFIDILQ